MNLDIIILSGVSQTEKEKYHMITNMWNMEYNLKYFKRTYSQNRNRLKDFETKLMVTKGKTGKGIKPNAGIDMYILLYMEWMSNKDLLYSIGKSTRYSVIT